MIVSDPCFPFLKSFNHSGPAESAELAAPNDEALHRRALRCVDDDAVLTVDSDDGLGTADVNAVKRDVVGRDHQPHLAR